jgi:AcrR family transcriptional regulator
VLFTIQMHLSEALYVRDPEQTELGRRIVDHSIQLIDEVGFERFTFKKLAKAMGSTEASVYRYFENKHRLLVYLVSWYWSWIDYRIAFHTNNIEDAQERLRRVVAVLAVSTTYDPNFCHIDEMALHRIVVVESNKAYQTKWVDEDNKEGLFAGYKGLCLTIANLISEVDPEFLYPRALASTVIEASHQQIFFAQHLPSLTELKVEGEAFGEIAAYLEALLFRQIGSERT